MRAIASAGRKGRSRARRIVTGRATCRIVTRAISITGAVHTAWWVGGASAVGRGFVRDHGQTLSGRGCRLSVQGCGACRATCASFVTANAIGNDPGCALVGLSGGGAIGLQGCAGASRCVAVVAGTAISLLGAGLAATAGCARVGRAGLRRRRRTGAVTVAFRLGGKGDAVRAA